MDKLEKKTEFISFRTTAAVKKALEEIAREKEWSTSQLSEKIIREYILARKEGDSSLQ